MINIIKESIQSQFGAAIDTLKNVIILYPDDEWDANLKFFYNAYHCALMLDYYLTVPPKNFSPLLPFKIVTSLDKPAGVVGDMMPERIYTKEELLNYLLASRTKCFELINGLTEDKMRERFVEDYGKNDDMNYSLPEILLYNIRHVQHHAAQLNMMMRQQFNIATDWMFRAEDLSCNKL